MSGRLEVSVVTPSYNQGRFLEATIRSVLGQDYPDLEYVIIDGGSADGGRDIIARYAQYLAFWTSEPDRGQADAINKGWRRARGNVLAYLNSDDRYEPHAVSRAVRYLEAHPDVDIAYGALAMIDCDGKTLEVVRPPAISLAWLLRYPLPQPTMFVRRRVVERVGWLDEALHYTMDWDFCLRAAAAGSVFGCVPGAPLAGFRVWGGQKTADGFERQLQEQFAIRDRLLSGSLPSGDWRGAVRYSKAWAFLWPAYQQYVHGELRGARRLLRRAAVCDWRVAAHPEWLGLYGRTLLGRRVSCAARRLKAAWSGSAR